MSEAQAATELFNAPFLILAATWLIALAFLFRADRAERVKARVVIRQGERV